MIVEVDSDGGAAYNIQGMNLIDAFGVVVEANGGGSFSNPYRYACHVYNDEVRKRRVDK